MSDRTLDRYDEIEKEIEKMQSASAATREESFHNLYNISKDLGSENTVQYLIPFLKTILDTNEEAKRPILEQIDKIVRNLVEDTEAVLPIYKEVFLTRDNGVRKEGASLLVGEVMYLGKRKNTMEGSVQHLEGFIQALGESRFIMHRLSSVFLVQEFVAAGGESAGDSRLGKLFAKLLDDPSSVVRKCAVSSTAILSHFYGEAELRGLTEKALGDPEDSVRRHFVAPLSLLPHTEENGEFLIKVFKETTEDESWQIRKVSVGTLDRVAAYVYTIKQEEGPAVLEQIEVLLGDREEEVRKAMVRQTESIVRTVPSTKEKILYFLDKASKDKSSQVRQLIPNVLSQISDLLTKENMHAYVLLIIRRLLTDEDRETKMETISRLRGLYAKLGSEAIAEMLTPVITDLDSTNWRTRMTVLKSVASLSTQIEKEYFKVHLKSAFFKMFVDPVWVIRKEAAKILSELAQSFGPEWVLAEALPSLEYLKQAPTYMHRISFAEAAGQVLQNEWPADITQALEKSLADLSKDTIPQVRSAVGKALKRSTCPGKEEVLSVLQADKHPEVRRSAL
ncbi:serine/threonine-protein phosphatase 2A regulatory subunit A [Nematocida sp. AWRm77]|nr:serine/threonine-protein phosphatase 2A regulatory subunit A [Nematocida sp. AWRm77]